MADRADLNIYQGDNYTAFVTVVDDLGAPADITGYSARAQIREDVADCSPVPVIDMATIVDSPHISLSIPPDQTAELRDEYVWDLEITSPDGVITTLLRGLVRVMQEVTR